MICHIFLKYAASFLIILCTSGSSLFPVLDFQTSRFPQRNNMSFVTFFSRHGGGVGGVDTPFVAVFVT